MTLQLRPYQDNLKQGVYNSWNHGNRNVLAVLPTGGGKSKVMTSMVIDGVVQNWWQVVLAHRNELVTQMSMHLAQEGLQHRIVGSKETVADATAMHREEFNGRSFVNPDSKLVVGSVQTINARAEIVEQWAAQVMRWYQDEAHHLLKENIWGKATSLFTNAYGAGFTATPSRADNMGLGRDWDGVMDDMVLGPTMRYLIEIGALCDYEIALPDSDFEIDESAFDKNGELSPKKGREASKRSHIVGDVVEEYSRLALGKQFICFATDVETAGEMATRFNDAGIPCAAVSAKTPTHVRNEMIRRFKRGQIRGLVNVDLFGEGFDVPGVEVVIMARPTASLAVFLQQFGRALRPKAGKLFGLVIDHVSNWKRHGLPDKLHKWSLARQEKRSKRVKDPEEIALTRCTNEYCGKLYEAALPACKHCGEAPPLPEPRSRTIEMVAGNLLLLDRDMLAQMRAATELESPADMGARVEHVAGTLAGRGAVNRQIVKIQSQQRLKDAMAQWAAIQRHKGRSDEETHRRFYLTTGVDVLSALALDDRQKYDEMSEMIEGWCAL